MMAVYAVIFFIPALLSRSWAFKACHAWCVLVRWALRWIVGLETEVRGTPPDGEVVIAAKHQSFLDIILIYNAVPRGKFIMKRELMYAPFLGQYALRLGCVPVDRGKRGAAIEKMKRDVEKGRAEPGTVDHLSARHARRTGRQAALQGGHRHSLRTAWPALHPGGRERRAFLAETRRPAQTPARRW